MNRSTAAAALAALAIAACAQTPAASPRSSLASEPALTEVYAWRDAGAEVVVRTPSNGCTSKDSFETLVTGSGAGGWTFDLALTRVEEDLCRAYLPEGVELVWTKDELGLPDGAEVQMVNPVRPAR
ncbi:MAG: hypothetical protein ABL308_10275 [Oceanicaulis sp.]